MRVARVVSEVGCDGGRARHASPRVHIVNIQSKNQARKLVREAQTRAYEERAQRERDNVDDLDTFLVARTRFAGVEEWQADRVTQIGVEADRRRDEHRAERAVALARLRARGETIATSAKLAGVSEREVRAYLKAVPRNGDAVGGAAAPPRAPAAGTGRERGRWRVVGRGGLKAIEISPVIGYDKASAIAHDADRTRRTLRETHSTPGRSPPRTLTASVNPATMFGPF